MADRIIRDELLDSDRYLGLSSDTARMLFVHMLLVADDLGNTEAGFGIVRRRLLPHGASPESVTKLLSELADADLIRLYEADGKRYAHIPRFRQRLRSYKNAHPRPPVQIECNEIRHLVSEMSDKCRTSDRQVSDTCPTPAAEGREGRKEEKRTTQRERGSRLPVDWRPDAALLAWASSERPDLRIEKTIEAFRDFWHAKPGAGATKLDWGKTFRTWVRNERKAPGSRNESQAAADPWTGAR